jgi:hypothetical protein
MLASPRTRANVLSDALLAELSKLRTLPATWLTLCGTVAFAALLAFFFASQALESRAGNLNSLDIGMSALPYAQAGLFVFGVIAACSEFIGGQIESTLTVIPNRGVQGVAATFALVTIALPAALVTVLTIIGVTALVLGKQSDFPMPETTVRIIVSAVVYLVLMVIFSAAVGSITRRALPAAGALVLYLFVASTLILRQPFSVYLPDIAGYTLWFTIAPDNAPSTPVAWTIILGWTFAAYTVSIALKYRDV